ncbi:MAG: STAS domain-containing protein [Lachnospiraceae bacterium]|nr:STAS domain-containing protein [Lachnospiraceae bacterium]MBR4542613.1 STAS domain-containing protein [Lachnospiraceae bacterium]
MTVNKELNGSELVISVSGRIDTTTAPTLEGEIKDSLDGVQNLVLDIAEVEYVSSAGLRVFLSTHKTMSKQGSMVVKNVSESVREIFEVTGFADILTLE